MVIRHPRDGAAVVKGRRVGTGTRGETHRDVLLTCRSLDLQVVLNHEGYCVKYSVRSQLHATQMCRKRQHVGEDALKGSRAGLDYGNRVRVEGGIARNAHALRRAGRVGLDTLNAPSRVR